MQNFPARLPLQRDVAARVTPLAPLALLALSASVVPPAIAAAPSAVRPASTAAAATAPAPAAPAMPAVPAAPPAPVDAPDAADVQARLDAARQRLEQSAQEVADLSLKLGGTERLRMLIDTAPPERPRPMLGLQIDPASRHGGATVAAVSPGGPAAQAGVRAGDVIVALGSRDLSQEDEAGRALVQALRDVPAGKPLALRVLRAGKTQELSVTPRLLPLPPRPPTAPGRPGEPALPALAGRGAEGIAMLQAGAEPMLMKLQALLGGVGGMELANLSPQLGRYFGAEQGVLVVHAPADAAWKLEDGDVITSIDGRVPNSGAHATRILASYQPGEKVALQVLRLRKPMHLDIVMPASHGEPASRHLRIQRDD